MLRRIKNIFYLAEALAANLYYRFPSRSISVIGVTGTDGKTTTSHLIYHILKTAGKNVSITSSVYTDIAGDVTDTGLHVTTQNRWNIQKNIRNAVNKHGEYFILETTSHGIDQYRVWGVRFDYAVLTNITHEHLDYHKTYDNYLVTKAKLLLWAKKSAVVNKEDSSYEGISLILESGKRHFVSYALKGDANYIWLSKLKTPFKEDFNKENVMAALACCREMGVPMKDIFKGIRTFTLPKGRFDCVYDKDYKVYIDFAHTPNSIVKLLSEL